MQPVHGQPGRLCRPPVLLHLRASSHAGTAAEAVRPLRHQPGRLLRPRLLLHVRSPTPPCAAGLQAVRFDHRLLHIGAVPALSPHGAAGRQLPGLPLLGRHPPRYVALSGVPRLAAPLRRRGLSVLSPTGRRQRAGLLPAVLSPGDPREQPRPGPHDSRRRRRQPARTATVLRRHDPQEAEQATRGQLRAGVPPDDLARRLPGRPRAAGAVRLATRPQQRHRAPRRTADPRARGRPAPSRRRPRRPARLDYESTRRDLAWHPGAARHPRHPRRPDHRQRGRPSPRGRQRHRLPGAGSSRLRRHAARRPATTASSVVRQPHRRSPDHDAPRAEHVVPRPARRLDHTASDATPQHRDRPHQRVLGAAPRQTLGPPTGTSLCAGSPATTSSRR